MNTTQRKAYLSRAQAHVDAADIFEQVLANTPRWRVVKRFLLRRWAAEETELAAKWMRIHIRQAVSGVLCRMAPERTAAADAGLLSPVSRSASPRHG